MPSQPISPDVTSADATVDDDDAPRLVPAGTWASGPSSIEEPDESTDRPVARSSQPPPARQASIPPPAMGASTSSSSIRLAAAGVVRPPYLASVLLRKRDEQRDPICVPHGRAAAVVGGALVATLAFALGSGLAWGVGGVAAALALAGLAPVPEQKRASLLAALGLLGCGFGLALRGSAIGATGLFAVLTLGAGLVLRSRRLASYPARALVALGAVLASGWLVANGLSGATAASFEAAALVGPAIALSLVVTLALVLLAFVDDHGSSGGGWLAILVMCWGVAESLAFAWPLAELSPAELGGIAASLFVPATAIALAQVFGGFPSPKRVRSEA